MVPEIRYIGSHKKCSNLLRVVRRARHRFDSNLVVANTAIDEKQCGSLGGKIPGTFDCRRSRGVDSYSKKMSFARFTAVVESLCEGELGPAGLTSERGVLQCSDKLFTAAVWVHELQS